MTACRFQLVFLPLNVTNADIWSRNCGVLVRHLKSLFKPPEKATFYLLTAGQMPLKNNLSVDHLQRNSSPWPTSEQALTDTISSLKICITWKKIFINCLAGQKLLSRTLPCERLHVDELTCHDHLPSKKWTCEDVSDHYLETFTNDIGWLVTFSWFIC